MTLLILGNGFDLYCQLKSSFKDYYESEINTGEILDFINSFDFLDSKEKILSHKFNEFIEKNNGKKDMLFVLLDTYSVLDILLCLNKEYLDPKWSDIENAIQKLLLYINETNELTEHKSILNTDSNKFKIKSLMLLTYIKHFIEKDILKFMYDHIIKFENRFSKYLKIEFQKRQNLYYTNFYHLGKFFFSKQIIQPNSYILSFNYTQPNFLANFSTSHIINIHGTLSSRIIIGIDQLLELETNKKTREYIDDNLYVFSKTSKVVRYQNKLSEEIKYNNIHEIVIFGHSLSSNDYSYFQAIFDALEIYSNFKVKLVFLYYEYLNTDSEFNFISNNAFNLIRAYGNTLDNKDHGKNLLHKLILEGRLVFKEVTVKPLLS